VNIAIFGLGYVGVVSAACLARDGHKVLGVDPSPVKTDLINEGKSPIVERGLEELIESTVASGHLRASADYGTAVRHADLMLICVGTPGAANGSLDLRHVRRVCEQIGETLAEIKEFKVIAIRSTLLPGSMQSVVIPTLEKFSGKRAGKHFGICINPEFMREGSAIYDYDHPPKTVIGSDDERSAAPVRAIYAKLDAPMIVTDLRTAEMVKYVDNSWHALKVTFANEIGRLAKAMTIDSRALMSLFCMDTKLNISTTYLRPGFAFGGSCLPKDVRALTYKGRLLDVETPVLSSILASNQVHIDRALTLIRETGRRRVGLLGLSFKEGTDDLRESPIVSLAEQLIGKGFELLIYDRNVKLATLVGSNLDYILNHIPHIGRVLVDDPVALFAESDVVVVATGEREFANLVARHGSEKMIIDLAGTGEFNNPSTLETVKSYEGIAWYSGPDHSRESTVPVRSPGVAGGARAVLERLPREYHLPEGARI
jgi:GDP-mannose 6-dehydrogenase